MHVDKAMYHLEFNESTSYGGFKVSQIPAYLRKASDWVAHQIWSNDKWSNRITE